jgi:hypothetical protein
LQWGDTQFGTSEQDSNRYSLFQHNWVNGRLTSPKNRKSRRVDMSRQLRAKLAKDLGYVKVEPQLPPAGDETKPN